jgi:hypothetical protein
MTTHLGLDCFTFLVFFVTFISCGVVFAFGIWVWINCVVQVIGHGECVVLRRHELCQDGGCVGFCCGAIENF